MCSHFCNFTLIQDHYLVGIANSGKAVRHHDNRFPLVEIREVFGDGSLVVGIKGIGSFVQKYERRILIDYPRNKYALSLPLADTLPILSYHRVISQRQGFDIVGDVCHTSSMADTLYVGFIV